MIGDVRTKPNKLAEITYNAVYRRRNSFPRDRWRPRLSVAGRGDSQAGGLPTPSALHFFELLRVGFGIVVVMIMIELVSASGM